MKPLKLLFLAVTFLLCGLVLTNCAGTKNTGNQNPIPQLLTLKCVPFDSIHQIKFAYNGEIYLMEASGEPVFKDSMVTIPFVAKSDEILPPVEVNFWIDGKNNLLANYAYLEVGGPGQKTPDDMMEVQKEHNIITILSFTCPIPQPWNGILPGSYQEANLRVYHFTKKVVVSSPASVEITFKTES